MALTFRTRLTLWHFLCLLILLTVTMLVLLTVVRRAALQKFDDALWMVGAAEAEGIAAALQDRGQEQAGPHTITNFHYRQRLGYTDGPLEKYVTLADRTRGAFDYSSNLKRPLPVDSHALAASFAGGAPVVSTPVRDVGALRVVYMPVRGPFAHHPFIVLVGLPESFVDYDIYAFQFIVASVAVVLLILIGLSSRLLVDRCLIPIREVAIAAESLSNQRGPGRLPMPRVQDEIGKLVTAVNVLLDRLESTLEAQRRFTARAAHELRTPLTIIKGETQVALRAVRTPAEYQQLLASTLEEVERLNSLIDNLLQIARYESGALEPPRDPVRFDKVVEDVLQNFRPLADARGIRIEYGQPPAAVLVAGDLGALNRLFRNLLENAIYYTPRGGRVYVELHRHGDGVQLSVQDTGIGIPAGDLNLVFESFYRSSSARELRPDGTGLGLSTVAAIARFHAASVEVTSEEKKGSKFIVRFPVQGGSSTQLPTSTTGTPGNLRACGDR